MGEGDHPAKEEALRRLSEPEGDHELHTFGRRSTGCTSHTRPAPRGSRIGEKLLRVARRKSGLSIMTRPWASWRWICISPILAQWIPACAGMTVMLGARQLRSSGSYTEGRL
jgi:hypothetical protein